MPRLSLWREQKSNDFNFIDNTIREQFLVGGTAFLVHKYLGPEEQGATDDPSKPNYTASGGSTEIDIQDLLFLETRDRKYDLDIYELRGVYNVGDNDFDLTQFGLFLSNDVLFISFHISDMVEKLGRRLMPGDVFELPHLRDDLLLDPNADAINKFYVVQDASRGAEGFSPTWFPHIWRVKAAPLTDSQEYKDIIGFSQAGPEGTPAADPDCVTVIAPPVIAVPPSSKVIAPLAVPIAPCSAVKILIILPPSGTATNVDDAVLMSAIFAVIK